jgi:formylglycine-generating enzyme required for sulfatase activity
MAAMQDVLLAAEQSPDTPDFSQVPPIQPELLEPRPVDISSLKLAPDYAWSGGDAWQSERRQYVAHVDPWDQTHSPSRPSRRADAPHQFESGPLPSLPKTSISGPSQPIGTSDTLESLAPPGGVGPTSTPIAIQAMDADFSLPMLENIWEQMEEAAPQLPSQLPSGSSEPLLKRSTESALEHLRKGSSSKRERTSHLRTPRPESPASFPSVSGGKAPVSQQPTLAVEATPRALSINWMRMLIAAFAISGLSGIGLLSYTYYQTAQEERRREATELQQRQEEAAAHQARESSQRREAEIRTNLEQARTFIATKDWDRARIYLDRAANLSPNHPAVAAAQSELLTAQRPGSNSKTLTDNTTGLELKWVEGGCFNMGSPATEPDHGNDESSHQVCVNGFWMGTTEITNRQYRQFRPDHDSGSVQERSLNGDDQPAVNLTAQDAQAFAEWLSWEAGAGRRFRLPTEAEWEFAARAGTTTRYYWGNDIDPRYANFSDRNDPTGAAIGNLDDGHPVSAPVGSYLPNSLGLHDMAGNVWEWTCSEYNPNYGGPEQRCSTRRPAEGQRVVRGGSWNNGPGELRSAKRLPRKPDGREPIIGFRLVMEE